MYFRCIFGCIAGPTRATTVQGLCAFRFDGTGVSTTSLHSCFGTEFRYHTVIRHCAVNLSFLPPTVGMWFSEGQGRISDAELCMRFSNAPPSKSTQSGGNCKVKCFPGHFEACFLRVTALELTEAFKTLFKAQGHLSHTFSCQGFFL